MVRVLHVLEAVRGGTSRHVVDIVRTTPAEHHVVMPVLGRAAAGSGAMVDLPAVAALGQLGAVVHHIDMRRAVAHPTNPVAAARLVALTRRVRPDVLHGHSSVGGALARMAGPPTQVPVVYTPNGLATGRAAVGIERLLGRATAALVAVSESEAALARQLAVVPPARLWVIPNGVDLHPPAPASVPDLRSELRLAPGTPLIATVARLVEQKAPQEFVGVWAAVARRRPDVHGLLIGMGPLQANVDRAVADTGLDGGFHQIPHLGDAWATFDQVSVFVLASRFEGGPYTPLEAMRAGVPVVLSDVVGNRDVVEHQRSGVLCAFGDVEGMAQAIVELLDQPARRAAMVEAARGRLAARFDVRVMGQALGDLYRSLAGQ